MDVLLAGLKQLVYFVYPFLLKILFNLWLIILICLDINIYFKSEGLENEY